MDGWDGNLCKHLFEEHPSAVLIMPNRKKYMNSNTFCASLGVRLTLSANLNVLSSVSENKAVLSFGRLVFPVSGYGNS